MGADLSSYLFIHLDSPAGSTASPCYNPGDKVSGRACLEFPKPLDVLSVALRFTGVEECQFNESLAMNLGGNYHYTKHFTKANSQIMNSGEILLYKFELVSGTSPGLMGRHEFPFELELPKVL